MAAPFDGRQFSNPGGSHDKTLGENLRWKRTGRPAPWPNWQDTPQQAAISDPGTGLAVQYINHATCLIRLRGLSLLTDPVWSKRVGPGGWIGPRRTHPPGVRLEDLPPIDWILLSHDHYDHCDRPTLRRLAQCNPACGILCGRGHHTLLSDLGFSAIHELDWGQDFKTGPATVHFVPARHWSNRTMLDRRRRLWGGFVVQAPATPSLYYAGDTAYGTHFEEIRSQYGPIDLALLPIGAYAPRWFMREHHMDPTQAVTAHQTLEARQSMALHFGTFPLADDNQEQAVTELAAARQAAGLEPGDFITPTPGQDILLP